MKIIKNCIECGKKYQVIKSRANTAKFCSITCGGQYRHKNHNEERICIWCGKTFQIVKSSPKKYCSYMCSHKSTERKIEKVCIVCGKSFKVVKPIAEDQKFCSRNCWGQYKHNKQSVIRKCKVCGREFSVTLSRIQLNKGKYCSSICRDNSIEIRQSRKQRMIEYFSKANYQPNKIECELKNIIQDLNLPYKFVGNGEVWIAGLNPDFINTNSQKKIIELFGEPWHQEGYSEKIRIKYSSTEDGRKKIFGQYGYDTLVIWSKELSNMEQVKQKLLDFENSPHRI